MLADGTGNGEMKIHAVRNLPVLICPPKVRAPSCWPCPRHLHTPEVHQSGVHYPPAGAGRRQAPRSSPKWGHGYCPGSAGACQRVARGGGAEGDPNVLPSASLSPPAVASSLLSHLARRAGGHTTTCRARLWRRGGPRRGSCPLLLHGASGSALNWAVGRIRGGVSVWPR